MEMTMIDKLPDGMHRLSDESIASIVEYDAEQTARIAKRGS
jgi:hypothetical protein